jgi:hypothetical protein
VAEHEAGRKAGELSLVPRERENAA